MDLDLINIISSVGFPISAYIMLFWKMNKDDEKHKEEIDKLSEVVNNNTITLQRLIDKLGSADKLGGADNAGS